MVERVDMDGSGSIEFLEFLLLMGKILQETPSTDDLRSIFTGQHSFHLLTQLWLNSKYRGRQLYQYNEDDVFLSFDIFFF